MADKFRLRIRDFFAFFESHQMNRSKIETLPWREICLVELSSQEEVSLKICQDCQFYIPARKYNYSAKLPHCLYLKYGVKLLSERQVEKDGAVLIGNLKLGSEWFTQNRNQEI